VRDDRAGRDRVEAVIQTNLRDLLAYAERRVLIRADAADILGDAIETIWRRSDAVPREPREARMWMFRVVRNTLLNAERARRRRDAARDALRSVLELGVTPMPTDEQLDVRAAIDALPAELAELVKLIHWDGFNVAQAGAIMGLLPSTARTRYGRARDLLRRTLDPDAEATHVGSKATSTD
jgi:RNA polymerase sigma-70 factor (ECF subfamily)